MTWGTAGLVRPWNAAILALLGTVLGAVAGAALVHGPPRSHFVEAVELVAVGAVPASVIAALPILTLGLVLLPFRATRGSGITLSAYAGAYLFGLAVGGGVAWLRRP